MLARTALIFVAIFAIGAGVLVARAWSDDTAAPAGDPQWDLSEDEWRERLTEDEFHVLREMGTERAFTGKYWDLEDKGTFHCAACGAELFSSETKYKSGTGWPSYWAPVSDDAVGTREDRTLFTTRTEVHCKRCGGHLGHVFDDGPEPTGLRYCINSVSLDFTPAEGESEEPTTASKE